MFASTVCELKISLQLAIAVIISVFQLSFALADAAIKIYAQKEAFVEQSS